MTILSKLAAGAIFATTAMGAGYAVAGEYETKTFTVTRTFYCTGGFIATNESGDQHWVRKICRPVICTNGGCVYADATPSLMTIATTPPIPAIPVPMTTVVFCTRHLAEPNGYLTLRIQPGPPFDDTNKVAELPTGTCGIVPTGPSVMVGQDRWAEVTIGNVRGWVNVYYIGRVVPTMAQKTEIRSGETSAQTSRCRLSVGAEQLLVRSKRDLAPRLDWLRENPASFNA
jgi:hypothetical protein